MILKEKPVLEKGWNRESDVMIQEQMMVQTMEEDKDKERQQEPEVMRLLEMVGDL